jgi:site-specific DNA-methyltransferase (adenine-specific)
MQLIHGDCLEKMKDIPDKSIDMILCDLPYGTTACKWDVVIPFEPLWEQYKRIIKDRGAIVLFGNEPFSSHLRLSNLTMYKYDWYWLKNQATGVLNAKKQPLRNVENICVFNTVKYIPQNLVEVNIPSRNSKKDYDNYGRGTCKTYTQQFTNYPTQVLRFDSVQRTIHSTQKPVALLEYLIKTYTLEGETVLDNTMGSGSTGVACINTKRNFIGIEKDDKYFEIAKKRIEEHLTTALT